MVVFSVCSGGRQNDRLILKWLYFSFTRTVSDENIYYEELDNHSLNGLEILKLKKKQLAQKNFVSLGLALEL